ncbi:MAG: hypothetical protein ABIL76_04190 [candidate division WOR-3 bacterium]
MIKKLNRLCFFVKRLLWKKKNPLWFVTADVRIRDKDGNIIWERKNCEANWNGLMNEGENNILDVYFRNQNAPTTFYAGLGNSGGGAAEPPDNATLATITELGSTNTGYSRLQVERNTTGFPSLVLDAGDWMVESKTLSWSNTGTTNWTAIDYVFLTDVASGTAGKLILTVSVGTAKTLAPNQSLDVVFKIKAQ